MIHLLQEEHIEVAKIAGEQERQDLAAPVLQHLVTDRPYVDDQVREFGMFAFANDVAAGRDGANIGLLQGRKYFPVVGGKADVMLKLAAQIVGHCGCDPRRQPRR